MHGLGNDYIVVDGRFIQKDWSALSLSICDRHMAVGADGLLVLMDSDVSDVRMRMFNPDGSEAEMCGNGIRCVAKYVFENDFVIANPNLLKVETIGGIKGIEPVWRGNSVVKARVDMGQPELIPERIPVVMSDDIREGPVLDFPVDIDGHFLSLSFVSMGNPHAVAFIDAPINEFPLGIIGPKVENHTLFPNKVNFAIVNVIEKGRVEARVWERGAGETLACGTGACAIAVASRLHDYMDEEIDIALKGGLLTITWDGEHQVFMEGPAVEVFRGEWVL